MNDRHADEEAPAVLRQVSGQTWEIQKRYQVELQDHNKVLTS